MLEYEEALTRILAAVPAPVSEPVSLKEAHGRVLAEPLISPIDLPAFDNSAMDGYAVRASDVASAAKESPARLRLVGKIPAGEPFHGNVERGTCIRLFTGSALPAGADSVVMQEDTRLAPGAGEVLVLDTVKRGENVRFQGEDVKRGSRLIQSGERVKSGQINLLGSVGVARVSVGRRPIVGILATGTELREPGQQLAPGQIYESNRVGLAALIGEAGAVTKTLPLVSDHPESVRQALETAFSECDAVVTSGGVSVGEHDYVKTAFEHLGGQLEFWKVSIKPGRPFVFGKYRNKLLFGLPGNPVSASVTCLVLVRPALLKWQGAVELALASHLGVLAESLANPGTRRHFMRVRVATDGKVFSAGTQASHVLSSLAAANGLVDVPPDTVLAKGTNVQVLRWEI